MVSSFFSSSNILQNIPLNNIQNNNNTNNNTNFDISNNQQQFKTRIFSNETNSIISSAASTLNFTLKKKFINNSHHSSSSISYTISSDDNEIFNLNNTNNNNDNKQVQITSEKSTALFIKGLNKDITEIDINNFFSKNYPNTFISSKICRDFKTKNSLGFGYLNFNDDSEIDAIIEELNYKKFFNNEIFIMKSIRDPILRKKFGTNVFISNLPTNNKNFNTRFFYDSFKSFGNIISCKINFSKKFGFIYFKEYIDAIDFIKKKNNTKYLDSFIYCNIHSNENKDDLTKQEIPIDSNIQTTTTVTTELNDVNNTNIKNIIKILNLPTNIEKSDIIKILPKINDNNKFFIFSKPLTTKTNNNTRKTFFIKCRSEEQAIVIKKIFEKSKLFNPKLTIKLISFKDNDDDDENDIESTNLIGQIKNSSSSTTTKPKKISNNNNKPKKRKQQKKSKNKPQNHCKVYLQNLSVVCNEEFLKYLTIQEHILTEKISITSFIKDPLTYFGFIICKNKKNASKLFNFLNNRLIGGSVINTSWQNYEPLDSIKINCKEKTINTLEKDNNYLQTQNNNNPQYYPQPQFNEQYGLQQQEYKQYYLQPSYKQIQYKTRKHTINTLKNHIKEKINFLQFPYATRENNLYQISEFIFDVYWYNNDINILIFLDTLKKNFQNRKLFISQIEQAATILGYSRN